MSALILWIEVVSAYRSVQYNVSSERRSSEAIENLSASSETAIGPIMISLFVFVFSRALKPPRSLAYLDNSSARLVSAL